MERCASLCLSYIWDVFRELEDEGHLDFLNEIDMSHFNSINPPSTNQ